MSELKARLQEATKTAMRARDKRRVVAFRLINAAVKQVEIDQRLELDDAGIVEILVKQVKQRQNSIEQFQSGGRVDLVEQEQFELDIINEFLPDSPNDEELLQSVKGAVASLSAVSMKDMGRVMQQLKFELPGSVDMKQVSALVREQLAS